MKEDNYEKKKMSLHLHFITRRTADFSQKEYREMSLQKYNNVSFYTYGKSSRITIECLSGRLMLTRRAMILKLHITHRGTKTVCREPFIPLEIPDNANVLIIIGPTTAEFELLFCFTRVISIAPHARAMHGCARTHKRF